MSKVVDRVRKLLALAGNSGASRQEVETAARLAQELMQEHKLTESDVEEVASDASEIVDLPAGREGFMATWRFALITSVARAFFCEAVGLRVKKSRKVRVVGRREDAEIVLEVTAFLTKEIERLTAEYGRLPGELFLIDEIMEGATAAGRRKAYRAGLAYGVSVTLDEQARAWRAASEKALAIYRKGREEIRRYMGQKFGDSKRQPLIDSNAESSAFDEGFARGQQIKIAPAAPSAPAAPPEKKAVAGKEET